MTKKILSDSGANIFVKNMNAIYIKQKWSFRAKKIMYRPDDFHTRWTQRIKKRLVINETIVPFYFEMLSYLQETEGVIISIVEDRKGVELQNLVLTIDWVMAHGKVVGNGALKQILVETDFDKLKKELNNES